MSQPRAFLETIIAFLLPYFIAPGSDVHDIRHEIIETLASYGTRTRAEMLQAAQIIALGMTTLDVLAEAKTAEMSAPVRLRYHGCANALNRSTLRTEQALDQRLACELPAAEFSPDLINDLSDAEAQSAVEHALGAIETHNDRLAAGRPATRAHPMAQENRDKRLWAGAMIDTLKQMGIPAQPVPGG